MQDFATEDDIIHEKIIHCRDCIYYVPESSYREEREPGVLEILKEPPGCRKWSHSFVAYDGEEYTYLPNVKPNGFCFKAERRESK